MMTGRSTRKLLSSLLLCVYLLTTGVTTGAFVSSARSMLGKRIPSVLHQQRPEISEMKLSDIRKELDSYGISTKAFLEKKEFIEALTKARAEGKQPRKGTSTTTKTASTVNGQAGRSRSERIEEMMTKAKSMSVAELRKELAERGINTKAFFEKGDFVKAYAEAIVDGVQAKSSSTSSSSGGRQRQQEEYDPSYRDVQMQKLDQNARRMLKGTVIDIQPN